MDLGLIFFPAQFVEKNLLSHLADKVMSAMTPAFLKADVVNVMRTQSFPDQTTFRHYYHARTKVASARITRCTGGVAGSSNKK